MANETEQLKGITSQLITQQDRRFREPPMFFTFQGGIKIEHLASLMRVTRTFTQQPSKYPEGTLFQADIQIIENERAIAQIYIKGPQSDSSTLQFETTVIGVDSLTGEISGGEKYGITSETHDLNMDAFGVLMTADRPQVALLRDGASNPLFIAKKRNP